MEVSDQLNEPAALLQEKGAAESFGEEAAGSPRTFSKLGGGGNSMPKINTRTKIS